MLVGLPKKINQFGTLVTLSPESSAPAAAYNTAAIQSVLNRKEWAYLGRQGTFEINDTLVMPSRSRLTRGPGVRLMLRAASNKSMIRNAAYTATQYAVSITAAGRIATVTRTGHGKAVGDPVAILGANEASYVGVWRVATVPTADTFTYEMFETPSATPATGSPVMSDADEDIIIDGDGVLDFNEANQTVSGTNDTHAVRIFNCIGGLVDGRIINAKKYAAQITNVDQFRIGHVRVDTASDGVHLCGPIGTLTGDCIEGKSGDDLFAVTLGDFATYEVARGPLRNVTIRSLKPRYALTALKIAGNPGFSVESLVIGSITGTVRRQSIYMTNDTNLTQTNTDRVDIGLVKVLTGVEAANTYQGIMLRGGTHKNFRIGKWHVLDNDSTDAMTITDATFGKVVVDEFYSRSSGVRKLVNIAGAAVIQKYVRVGEVDITQPDSASAIAFAVGGTANVPKLILPAGDSAPVAGTNARFVQVQGTTATLGELVCGIRLQGGNSLFDQAAAGQPAPIIRLTQARLSGYATGLNLRGDATVILDGVDWGTWTNRPIQTGTAGTVEVFGWNKKTSSRLINRGAGSTVYANGHTLVCDTASHQNARNGDMVTDTTSGLVVQYNGTAWAAVS